MVEVHVLRQAGVSAPGRTWPFSLAAVVSRRRWDGVARAAVLAGAVVVSGACGGPGTTHHPLAAPFRAAGPTTSAPESPPSTTAAGTVASSTAAPPTATAPAASATTAPATVPATNPQAALAALARSLGPRYATSPVTSPATYAAVAHASPPPSGPVGGVPTLVDVFRWDGSAWRPVATDLGSGASLDPQAGFTVTTAALTGGPEPDFVVTGGLGASSSGLFVVADVAGRWEAVPIDQPGGGVMFVDGRVAGNEVQESVQSCNPNCASGPATTTSYRFSAATGRFEPVGAQSR